MTCPVPSPGRTLTVDRPRRLMLVDPWPGLLRRAIEAGFAVWPVADARQPERKRELRRAAGSGAQLLQTDFARPHRLRHVLATTARKHRVERLLALGVASAMPAVLETAECLGLSPNPAESAGLLVNPCALRSLLNHNGHAYVASARAHSEQELSSAIASIGPPLIVKPCSTAGEPRAAPLRVTAGTARDACRAVRERLEGRSGGYLVEEFVDGPQYGVETLTTHGMHQVLGITRLNRAGPAGVHHLFPAPLDEREEAELRAAVTELLDLAGYEFGFAHTVVVLTGSGPRVVRSQARRADEPIDQLIELATGFAPESGLLQALDGTLAQRPAAHRYAAVAPFRLPARQPGPVSGAEEVTALPGVHTVSLPHAPNPPGPEPGPGGTRPGKGHVVLTAATAAEAAQRVTAAQRRLGAEATRVPPRPGADHWW